MWDQELFEAPIAFQTGLFGMLIKIGAIKPYDPRILALEFYTSLLLLYLNALPFEPDDPVFRKTLDYANLHMAHFREMYTIRKGKE